MSLEFEPRSRSYDVRHIFIATMLGALGALVGCGDDAHETGAGGASSSSTTTDTSTATSGASTSGTSSSTGGMCMPGPTSDPWVPIGPYGGSFSSVLAIGSNVIATENFSLVHSADAGQTWESVPLPMNAEFENLAKTSTDMFASGGYAIYRSTDGGLTWTDATLNLPTNFAGLNLIQLEGAVAVSDPSGTSPFYRWNATNQNWDDLHSPADASYRIAATGNDVYVSGSAGVLYASHSGGAFQPLTFPSASYIISAAGGSLVVLDTANHPYVSTNGGATFTEASTLAVGTDLVPTATGFVSAGFNGVFTSNDFGATWQSEATNAPMYTTWDTADASASTLFAAGHAGLYSRPLTGPLTWSLVPIGIHAMGPLAGDGTKLVASYEAGTSISSDGGATWNPSSLNASFNSLKMTKSGAFIGGGTNAQIFRSLDGGQTWNPSTVPPKPMTPAQHIYATALTETATSLLAATGDATSATGAGIYRSVDNGITWTNSNQGLPVLGQDGNGLSFYEAVTALASGPGFVFAGTEAKGVFVSTDDGATWTAVSSGMPTDPTGKLPTVSALAVSENSVIAATQAGTTSTQVDQVWRSNDHGTTWTDVSAAFPAGARVGSLSAEGELVYAGTGLGDFIALPVDGVYVSKDDGATWSPLLEGIEQTRPRAILITPSNLFVGTNDRSIFKHPLCPSN